MYFVLIRKHQIVFLPRRITKLKRCFQTESCFVPTQCWGKSPTRARWCCQFIATSLTKVNCLKMKTLPSRGLNSVVGKMSQTKDAGVSAREARSSWPAGITPGGRRMGLQERGQNRKPGWPGLWAVVGWALWAQTLLQQLSGADFIVRFRTYGR